MKDIGVAFPLPSGQKVTLSKNVFYGYYQNFNSDQLRKFYNAMDGCLYFPQIMQFIMVLRCFELGSLDFQTILLTCLWYGAVYTLLWYLFRLDKVPGLARVCCTLGKYGFRFCLHYLVLAGLAIFYFGDWRIILYCAGSGWITGFVNACLSARLSTTAYADRVVMDISKRNEKGQSDQKPHKSSNVVICIVAVIVALSAAAVVLAVNRYNDIQQETLQEMQRMENHAYAVAAINDANFSLAQSYMDKIENHEELYPEEWEYIQAGLLLEDGDYIKALKQFERISYNVPSSVIKKAKDSLYEQAKDDYYNEDYTFAKTKFSYIKGYRDTDKYLILTNAHIFSSDRTGYDEILEIITFEDAKDLIKNNNNYLREFLEGTWKTENKAYYLKVDDEHSFQYNLPVSVYNGYYYLSKGFYSIGPKDGTTKTNTFRFDIKDANTIEVYCFQNKQTYTMYRQ